jgi:5-methyltetrahydropteroyltriglutamate--homocysteine methyltransferase
MSKPILIGAVVYDPKVATIWEIIKGLPIDCVFYSNYEEALEYLPAERIFLNPDCGFETFSSRPMNSEEIAERKLRAMVQASRRLRERVAREDGMGAE